MPNVHTKKVSYDIDGNYGEIEVVNLFVNGHPEKYERQDRCERQDPVQRSVAYLFI